jgi:hypothetical protein
LRQCECGNARRPGLDSCVSCARIDAERIRQEKTPGKVESVLRHEDWLTSYEIRERIGIDSDDTSSVSSAIGRMFRSGLLERRRERVGWEYRLKEQKRRAA